MHKLFNLAVILLSCTLLLTAKPAEAKKFRRALIIAGGGISPGIGLGILSAAEEAGQMPDVVITTCGSSLSAAIYNAHMNGRSSLNYAKSQTFFNSLNQVRISTSKATDMGTKFDNMLANPNAIPQLFSQLVLSYPENANAGLPNTTFNSGSGPRFIMVTSRANFGPGDVGKQKFASMFTEAFFTDPDTAQALQNFRTALPPGSLVESNTVAFSNVNTETAMRASIADPHLLNPIALNGKYFFTGAVDLFPLELAQSLADEVIVTYPVSLFSGYIDQAFDSSFGFSQNRRVLQAINNSTVKWVDMSGADSIKFDPEPGVTITNKVPQTLSRFQQGIQTQFDFGYSRMREALNVQAGAVRHIREPISPTLYQDFSCKNAYAWKTDLTTRVCMNDAWAGCDRRNAPGCVPVR